MEGKRSRNFTKLEKAFLRDIVREYSTIVDNKKTDAASNKEKYQTWDKIARIYNESCQTGPRSAKQLKELYSFIKRKGRKGLYDEQDEIIRTEDGIITTKLDVTESSVSSAFSTDYEPDPNPYDSSSAFYGDVSEVKQEPEPEIEEPAPGPEATVYEESASCSVLPAIWVTEPPASQVLTVNPPTQISPQESPPTSSVSVAPIDDSNAQDDVQPTATASPLKSGAVAKQSKPEKRKYLQELADTIIERKATKNRFDEIAANKKLKIIDTESQLKTKEFEMKSIFLDKQLALLELEREIKTKELEIKVIEKNMKEIEYKMRLHEFQKMTENDC